MLHFYRISLIRSYSELDIHLCSNNHTEKYKQTNLVGNNIAISQETREKKEVVSCKSINSGVGNLYTTLLGVKED